MGKLQRRLTVFVVVLAFSSPALAHAASTWQIRIAGTSAAAARSAAAPTAPTGVTGTCVSSVSQKVTVAWTAVTRATSYTVFQSTTSASSGFSVAASGVTATTWTSATLTSGRTYWYQVSASVGSNWVSPNSASTTGRQIRSSVPNCS
ncbi:MAG: hypothetical protein QOJ92_2126 [Frankiales bacterium]|nr:hypothetical protein [Frankiales bacterium]